MQVERSKDRQFKSTVRVGGDKYSSSCWSKSKKSAEQAAASVALIINGIDIYCEPASVSDQQTTLLQAHTGPAP